MDGTTEEQDKIRRATLMISLILLLVSCVSFFLYQYAYQTRLNVTVTSKKLLPETEKVKKNSVKSSKKPDEDQTVTNKQTTNEGIKELEQDPLKQLPETANDPLQKKRAVIPSSKIFKLGDTTEYLP
ncbi:MULTISPECIES: hypothetical protein [unclassified Enterococcus]|uniref:hypothetical protein n=1 Tax=unclassified Enterococcus TaxID=2608891 RepID=UPI000A32B5F8|nr:MULTISPECIES: hypothetical protein [unclassified Enterococcus]OTO72858.1 hypothetical protein A5865_001813 [Enterococcus sp. 12E11_DIV0728]OUZ14314.1 hypothetical protein A5868_003337 [Enterococcus sp. 12F9_DIV0723]